MYEVELKLPVDHDSVRPRFDSLGVAPRNKVEQVDAYFDAPHRAFDDTGETLRIRTQEAADRTTTELTYKGPLVEEASKTREELTTDVNDPDATTEILTALGFEQRATVRKRREQFDYGECTITLDDVDRVGEFLEVETAVDSEAEVAAARERAVELLDDLGLDADEQTRRSYLDLTLAQTE